MEKVHTKQLPNGSRVHSLRSLLRHLGGIVRNTCRCHGADPDAPTFTVDTTPNEKQQEALDLLQAITV